MELAVSEGKLFTELGVVVGEFFDAVVGKFEALSPGRVARFGNPRRREGLGRSLSIAVMVSMRSGWA